MGKINKNKTIKITCIVLISIFIAATFAFMVAGIIYAVRADISDYPLPLAIDQKILADSKPNSGDVRIMSSNLLVHYKSWGGKPVKPRAALYLGILKHYKPDVIGIQEMSEEWYAVLNKNMPDGYKILRPFETGVAIHLTAMIYNENTLKLVDNGEFAYKEKDNIRLRRVNFAIFKDKHGSTFGVTNTHLSLLFKGKENEYKKVMQSQANELIGFIKEIKAKYNCPIFSIGDFNSTEDKLNVMPEDNPPIYDYLCENLIDTKYSAINKLCGPEKEYNDPSYDHVFATGTNYEINSFNILAYDYLSKISDHYSIYADISL